MFREVPCTDATPAKVSSIQLSNRLPRADRPGEVHENAHGLILGRWWGIQEVHNHSFDRAVLRTLVTYKDP